MNNNKIADVTADANTSSSSFKCKLILIENKNGAAIAVPLKYLSNFSGH